uniref:Helicase ATP-binding domain-containing protein n=1 Tax=viral metagenome TaxID=1070528 RepID=A0A6C0LGB8_9ZZZZ
MSNQEKGLLYEKYVKDFIIRTQCKNAYLWNECPETILIDNKLIHSHNTLRLLRKDAKEGHVHSHKDIGIDIIQIENDKCSMVQCKNGYHNGLCVDDIAGIMMRSAFIRNINTFIYYTNCLSRNILYTSGISPYVSHIDCSNNSNIDELVKVSNDSQIYFVKLPYENTNIEIDIVPEIVAYSYQIEAVNTFTEYYKTKNRGILSLPCGCGKTFTSYLISNTYKQVIILSPLREFASQNLNKFIEYGYDKKNTRLVDSDGDRDIDSIKKFIQSNDRFVISCTYDSMDLLSECLELFNDALFIIDEFHNLSKANISSEDNNIYKLLISKHRILYMSATPRIYDIEYDDETVDVDTEVDNDYDENDEETDEDDDTDVDDETVDTEYLFGDVVYQMTFTDAITNKYITDYKIWLPSIHENNEELDKELSIYEIDNEIKNRCKFLYSCIANNGTRKSIVYCRDTEDMKAMMECMKTLNEFYIMDIEMNSISCEDNEKKRKRVLKSFSNGDDKIQLLFNIRILNECIDIPACDSVYISYPPKNKITTIQRISRSTRIDRNNPYKVANVYIWCEEYDDMLETLSSIKEYDIMFKDKVKVSAVDFYNNKDEKELEMIENDKILLSNCIIGVKEFKVISWEEKLATVEEYIKEYGRLPTHKLRNWLYAQRIDYNINRGKMKQKHIRLLWEIFIEKYNPFISSQDKWILKLEKADNYLNINDKIPLRDSQDIYIKGLGIWIARQKDIYKKNIQIMKDENIRALWETFISKYNHLFMDNDEYWKNKLNQLEQYINQNGKLPSPHAEELVEKTLGNWVGTQKRNYKKQIDSNIIMTKENIRALWEQFVNKHFNLFINDEDKWVYKLKQIQQYILENGILPTQNNDNEDTDKMALWICRQKKNYTKYSQIMKNENIRRKWECFVNENEDLLKSEQERWNEKLDIIKEYIKTFNKLPPITNNDENVKKLGKWISHQKDNYSKNKGIMKVDSSIREKWKQFENENYELFKSNEEVWDIRYNALLQFVEQYDKLPSPTAKEHTEKTLGYWVANQKKNYKTKIGLMNEETLIRKEWKELITKYDYLFKSNQELWTDNKIKLEEYIQKYNKLPPIRVKLGRWVSHQKQHYKKKGNNIIENEDTRKKWGDFISKYPHLF